MTLSPLHALHTTNLEIRRRDSVNKANCEVISPRKDAQPEGSTVNTTDDTKPQASTEKRVQNDEAQPEKSEAVSLMEPGEQPVGIRTAEKKDECVDTPVDQSKVDLNEKAAETSAADPSEVLQNGETQPVSKEITEAVYPVEPAEKPVSNTVSENKEENVAALINQSAVEHNEEAAKTSGDVCLEVIQSDEIQQKTDTDAVPLVEPAEQPVFNTTVEKKEEYVQAPVDQLNVEHNEDAAQISANVRVDEGFQVQPVSTETTKAVFPLEPAEQKISNTTSKNKEEYIDEPVIQSNMQLNEEAPNSSADVLQPVSTEKTEAVSPLESAEQPVANTTVEKKEDYVITPDDQLNVEYNNMASDISASVHVETPVAETTAEAETEDRKEAAEVSAVLTVELKPETEPTNVTNHEPAGVESNLHPAEGSCEKCPEKFTEETLETVAEVVEASLPETPAVTNAAAAQEAAIQDSVEPVLDLLADTVSDLSTQPAAETAVKSLESKAESAAPAQPVLNTGAEEENKSKVQAADNTAVEPELRIEDAVEPATTSAEAVQDKLVVRAIELTDALDVEAPTVDANPESVEDPKQPQSEEVKLNEKSDDNTDDKAVCSFCEETIDGNVRLIFSEPVLNCHPDCLTCGVCTEALGNLSTPMFLHDQVIHCGRCFAKALKT
ncbi:hypothetical protein PAMP_006848 [Pampus punctatissimus]